MNKQTININAGKYPSGIVYVEPMNLIFAARCISLNSFF